MKKTWYKRNVNTQRIVEINDIVSSTAQYVMRQVGTMKPYREAKVSKWAVYYETKESAILGGLLRLESKIDFARSRVEHAKEDLAEFQKKHGVS